MFTQSLAVALALFEAAFRPAMLRPWIEVVMVLAAVLTVASFGQYVRIGVRAARGPRSSGGDAAETDPRRET